jgi:uncharacterized protein (DUF4415 family)
MATKKFNYAKNSVLKAKDFSPKLAKERITIWIDEEVLDSFRARATAEGLGYQTLVNRALREATIKPSLVERVETLEKKLGVA